MALFRTGITGINTPIENLMMITGFIALIAGFYTHGIVMTFTLAQMLLLMVATDPYNNFARRALYLTPCITYLGLYWT